MRGTVDRIIENIVICEMENKQVMEIDISLFENRPKEGDVINYQENVVKILKEETEKKRTEVRALFNALKRKRNN